MLWTTLQSDSWILSQICDQVKSISNFITWDLKSSNSSLQMTGKKKNPGKKFTICWSLMVIYLPDAWTSVPEITASPLPGVEKHKSMLSPCPAVSQMTVEGRILKTHWVKGKKTICLHEPILSLLPHTLLHKSMSLIAISSLPIVLRGGEGRALYANLRALTTRSPIFKDFFTFLLPPILYLQLASLGSCTLKYLTWTQGLTFLLIKLYGIFLRNHKVWNVL